MSEPKPRNSGKKRRVTIMDVAKEAGVSIAAVSRILNNSYEGFSAREETKRRVHEAVKKLNYKASRAAVRLATGRHQAIAYCYPDTSSPNRPLDSASLETVFGQIDQMLQIHGLSRAAAQSNYDLVLMMRGGDRSLGSILESASESVDGLVYVHPEDDRKLLEGLAKSGLPVAVVGPADLPDGTFCSVRVDEFTAGRMAMSHLIVSGARRIAVTIPSDRANQRAIADRLEGIQMTVRKYSDPKLGFDVVELPTELELAKSAFLSHVGKWGRPDGVLTLGGLLPFAILEALREQQLRVPEEVKVVGFDENPWYRLHDPPITGIRYPIEEMCQKAGELLIEFIRTGKAPEPVILTPKMIARRSSEPPSHLLFR